MCLASTTVCVSRVYIYKVIPKEGPEANKVHLGSTTVCVAMLHISKVIPLGDSQGQQNVSRIFNSLSIQGTHVLGYTKGETRGQQIVSSIYNSLRIQGTRLKGNTKERPGSTNCF